MQLGSHMLVVVVVVHLCMQVCRVPGMIDGLCVLVLSYLGSRRLVMSGKWAGVEPMEPKQSIWINLLGK